MEVKGKRRSDRVNIAMPVRVSALDVAGQKFSEEARTRTISRHGATIILNRKLTPGQQLTLRCFLTGKEANGIVVGQIGGQSGGYVYGIASREMDVDLWDIRFPPLAESETGLVRLLLQCGACQAREVVYLNELETEVFEGNGALPRSCTRCSAWTVWEQTPHDLPDGHCEVQDKTMPEPALPAADRSENRRKHVRVRPKMKMCVRHPGFEEEVVPVEDASRGGLSFVSAKGYLEGSRIEVSLPYSSGGANIFVAARINRVQKLPGKELTKYGVAYLQLD